MYEPNAYMIIKNLGQQGRLNNNEVHACAYHILRKLERNLQLITIDRSSKKKNRITTSLRRTNFEQEQPKLRHLLP